MQSENAIIVYNETLMTLIVMINTDFLISENHDHQFNQRSI